MTEPVTNILPAAPGPGLDSSTSAPSTLDAAIAKRASLLASDEWTAKYRAKGVEQISEMTALNKLIASGGNATATMSGVETVDAVTNPSAMPRGQYDAGFDGLRMNGFTEDAEQFVRALDADPSIERPTAGDRAACKRALDTLVKSREWRAKVAAHDPEAIKTKAVLQSYIALADANDGKPISAFVAENLSRLGLR
jgi:hypothetical protein